jgi:hypothetical protein
MTMTQEQNPSQFVDLVEYKRAHIAPKVVRGNLIKADRVICTGTEAIHISAEVDDQPTVITHTEGDVIVAVEFRCKCGCSTTVALNYDRP